MADRLGYGLGRVALSVIGGTRHSNYGLFSLGEYHGENNYYLGIFGFWFNFSLSHLFRSPVAWIRVMWQQIDRGGWLQSLRRNGVVWPLQAASLVVFLMWHFLPGGFMHKHFVQSRGNIRAGRLWTLFTANISHYQMAHLVGNMITITSVGESLQARLGPLRVAELALLSGVTSSIASLLASPDGGSLGASGIAMGFHAASACLFESSLGYPMMRIYGIEMNPLTTLFTHLIADLMDAQSGRRDVDWAGHFGGALSGWLFVRVLQGAISLPVLGIPGAMGAISDSQQLGTPLLRLRMLQLTGNAPSDGWLN